MLLHAHLTKKTSPGSKLLRNNFDSADTIRTDRPPQNARVFIVVWVVGTWALYAE